MVSKRTRTGIFMMTALGSISAMAFAGNTDLTRRTRNDVREGPGSYYPLVCVLPAGSAVEILSLEGSWSRIRLQEASALPEGRDPGTGSGLWVSRNCFAEKAPPSPVAREFSYPWESLSASPSAVAAAVRGFALRFAPGKTGRLDELEGLGQALVTPEAARRFREESQSLAPCQAASRASLPVEAALRTPYEISLPEQGVGQGISARIADRGLLDNRGLQVYVNLLASFLAEHTGAYDTPFSVYVLQGDDLYAMAVPGGKIFLTQGVVRACNDEAELAAVIAHEMMHLILRHGVQEMGERPTQIKADLALAELDAQAGEPADPVMEGLERYATDAYESVHKPRLQRYEVEADRAAVLLLAQAGYDPQALPRMVSTLRDRVAGGGSSDNPFLSMDFRNRAQEASSFVAGPLKGLPGVSNRERFLRNTGEPECLLAPTTADPPPEP